jgi:hypothetical protein
VKRLLKSSNPPIRAVLTGWFGDPKLVGDLRPDSATERQIKLLLRNSIMPEISFTEARTSRRTAPAAGSMAKDRGGDGAAKARCSSSSDHPACRMLLSK